MDIINLNLKKTVLYGITVVSVALVGALCPDSQVRASSSKSIGIMPAKLRYQYRHLKIYSNTHSKYYNSIIKNATKDWNKKTCINFSFVKSQEQADIVFHVGNITKSDSRKLSGEDRYLIWDYGNFNKRKDDVYLYKGVLNKYHYSKESRVDVAEHELGHVLGYKDTHNKQSVMYYCNRWTKISKSDAKKVNSLYKNLPYNKN